jgi:hypothetical protein
MPPLSQNDLLRIQLRAEFRDIEMMIHRSVVLDPLTVQITDWLRRFREDLERNADAENVYRNYVEVLQDMLCDPITGAPLDDPQLGVEDGYTYGDKSLYVTRTPWPENEQNLSPMTRQPLTLVPHVLASYMILWLALRNDAQFSVELEEEYRKAVAQRQASATERLNRLGQRRLAREQVRKQAEDAEFLRLQNRFTTMREEHQADIQQLAEQVQTITAPLLEVRQEIQQAEERPIIPVEAIRHQMRQIVDGQFTPLETRVNAYATNTITRLAREEAEEKKDFESAQGLLAGATHQVSTLTLQNRELGTAGEVLQEKIEKLTQEQIQLEGNIKQLREENNRRRKKAKLNGLELVVATVCSVAVSFGLRAMGVPLSVIFTPGGASVST